MISLSDLESAALAATSYQGRLEFSGYASPSIVLQLISALRDLQARNPGVSFEEAYGISTYGQLHSR